MASANGSNGSANYQLQMGYSVSGNITNKAVTANVNDSNKGLMNISYMNQYSYNPAKPHQIANITDQNTNNSFNFEWDDNGNMTLHNEMVNGMTKSRRMCWDEENRMILSADEEQMAGYVYDAGGMRTHKASGTVVYSTVNGYPNSFATVSAFTLYPSELITVSSGMYTKHYYNGSSRIASRIGGGFNQHNDLNNYQPLNDHVQLQNGNDYTNKAQQLRNVWSRNASCAGLDQNLEYAYSFEFSYQFTNPQPDGERYFYHSDHLGSSAYITTEMRSIREDLWKTTWTEQNGYATQFLAYMPFGETLSEQQNSTSYYSPFKFSAKEKDPETGYSYFGARYYSPELSVWLGVDPMSDKYPSLSPYNYCALNPIMLVDPDGREIGDPEPKCNNNFKESSFLSKIGNAIKSLFWYKTTTTIKYEQGEETKLDKTKWDEGLNQPIKLKSKAQLSFESYTVEDQLIIKSGENEEIVNTGSVATEGNPLQFILEPGDYIIQVKPNTNKDQEGAAVSTKYDVSINSTGYTKNIRRVDKLWGFIPFRSTTSTSNKQPTGPLPANGTRTYTSGRKRL